MDDAQSNTAAAASGSPRNRESTGRLVFPRLRAVVAGLLFLAWIGYLLSLVVETRGRILVSGPQLRNADSVVVATLTEEDGVPGAAIAVKELLFPPNVQLAPSLSVPDLALISSRTGWQGPGDYVVPLGNKEAGKEPGVALMPMSPGYHGRLSEVKLEIGNNPDGVFKLLSTTMGVPAARLRELANGPTLWLANVPLPSHPTSDEDQAKVAKWRTELETAGARLILFRPGEARIYPATPDVLDRVNKILAPM